MTGAPVIPCEVNLGARPLLGADRGVEPPGRFQPITTQHGFGPGVEGGSSLAIRDGGVEGATAGSRAQPRGTLLAALPMRGIPLRGLYFHMLSVKCEGKVLRSLGF